MSVNLEVSGLKREDKIIKIANLNPTFANENVSIKEVVKKIILSGHRRIPITNKKNELTGIVTTMDILDAFLRQQNFNESIKSIMIREVIFFRKDETLEQALQKLKISRRGGAPIVEDENKKFLLGIANERDIVKHFINIPFNEKIEEVMTRKPLIISNKVSIYDCLKSIVNSHYRRLPVMDGKNLVGIVTSSDLINYILTHEYRYEDLHAPIDFLVKRSPITIKSDEDVSQALRLMVEKDVGGILVTDDNKNLVGIITERDILERIF
ncbi:MAG: CBS domain-containing protein [Candidatus Aenigmatarchaeota archaeon]